MAAALHLQQLKDCDADVQLFEAGPQLGGVLRTTRERGYLIEHSADNFITNVRWAVDVCERIGISNQLLQTDDCFRRAFVVHRDKLLPVPDGFALMAPARLWPIVTTKLLSIRGKLRLAWEYFLPPRRHEDESLQSFATRRLGKETYERIVQPLVGGIYTADPQRLSLAATLPRFLEMEHKHGGLIRGALRQSAPKKSNARLSADQSASGARYSLFVAPREGMGSLVAAMADALPDGCVRLNTKVERICCEAGERWRVQIAEEEHPEEFDHVIVATPAMIASRLLADTDGALSKLLDGIPYAGASVVCLGYRRDQIDHPLDGFGFVVPAVANRKILAGSFSSVKYPGRAPEGHVLIRVFVGGALQPELAALPDDDLQQLAQQELADLIGASGEPDLCHVTRWEGAMPQYHLGHLDRISQIEGHIAALPGLHLAGNAYHGVGIPQCIHSGQQAAERTHEAIIHANS